jgi:uncharacterized phage protein (TIGR02218 family)
LNNEVLTLASCWKITRRDSVVMGFTDHDQDLLVDSVLFQAATGFTPSAISNSASFNVDNLDCEGMLSSLSISEDDIITGKYDFAQIEIFKVNYDDTSQGMLKLRRGWFGEVSFSKNHFIAEVRGLTQRLSQTIGELYMPSCRASLGDSRCKIILSDHTVSGTVTTSSGREGFTDSARTEDSGLFSYGIVTFTSGSNSGLSMEVKEYVKLAAGGGMVTLALPMSYSIAAADAYTLSKGCDKTFETCRTRFSNAINFRGEPHIPGIDRILETAGTRSQW